MTWTPGVARYRLLATLSTSLASAGVLALAPPALAGELEVAAGVLYQRCLSLTAEGSGVEDGLTEIPPLNDGSAESVEGPSTDDHTDFGGMIVPMLAELPDHACTGLIDPTACAQWLRETSCDGMANALLPSVTEEVQSLSEEFAHLQSQQELPLWAGAVSDAMVAWVSRCYSLEAGTTMTTEEGEALRYWGRVLGQSLVMMTHGMEVDPQVAAACSQEVESWSCDAAGGQDLSELPLSDEDTACGELLTFDETFGE